MSAIENSIESSLEVQDTMSKAMQEAIQEAVYDVNEPEVYKRRAESGGLLDKRNMNFAFDKTEYLTSKKAVKFHFENQTLGHFYVLNGKQISDTIEKGIKKNWKKHGWWSEPRPFLEHTAELLKGKYSNELASSVAKALSSQGLNVRVTKKS